VQFCSNGVTGTMRYLRDIIGLNLYFDAMVMVFGRRLEFSS